MSRLAFELERLYRGPDRSPDTLRGLVLALARPADWDAVLRVWQGVQADLGLPAPAIAVNGVDGYQLWFAWAQPVPKEEAQAWLMAVVHHYLPEVEAHRLAVTEVEAQTVPALEAASGRWSAFVTADLARVFADEPGLDFAPNPDAQAELLSRLSPMPLADVRLSLARLAPPPPPAVSAPITQAAPVAARGPADLATDQGPRGFLLAVMQHPEVDLALRIDAAKALLGAAD